MAEEMFSFRINQVDLLSFKLPDFTHIETHRVEFNYQQNAIDFGNCVLVDSGYVYIYGTKNLNDFSEIHVARTPLNSKIFYRNWEYFAGNSWRSDIKESAPLMVDLSISGRLASSDMVIVLLLSMDRQERIYTPSFLIRLQELMKKTQYSTPETRYDSTGRLFTTCTGTSTSTLTMACCLYLTFNSINVRDFWRTLNATSPIYTYSHKQHTTQEIKT